MLLLFALFLTFFFACKIFFFKIFLKRDKKLDLNDEYDSSFNQILARVSSSKYSTTNIFF